MTEREEQRRRGRERRAPDESTKLRVRCDFFCTNATSGIMRRRRLMCESRVCPCPQGSAEWQKGETREEGGHAPEFVRTQHFENITEKATEILPLLFQLPLEKVGFLRVFEFFRADFSMGTQCTPVQFVTAVKSWQSRFMPQAIHCKNVPCFCPLPLEKHNFFNFFSKNPIKVLPDLYI